MLIAGSGAHFHLHQPLGGEADHVAKDIRVRPSSTSARKLIIWSVIGGSSVALRFATRPYRRTADGHPQATRSLRRYGERASQRLATSQLHHEPGHNLRFRARCRRKPRRTPSRRQTPAAGWTPSAIPSGRAGRRCRGIKYSLVLGQSRQMIAFGSPGNQRNWFEDSQNYRRERHSACPFDQGPKPSGGCARGRGKLAPSSGKFA